MFVKKLSLKNFRNYENGYVEFEKGVNVIIGKNATGKTNCVEALYILATSKSHRLAREGELIRFGEDYALIRVEFFSLGRKKDAEIIISSNGKKQFKINGIIIKKVSDLLSHFGAVIFSPDDLKLIKGAPKERRRMLDIGISKVRSRYFSTLIKYNRVLSHRNNLLKSHAGEEEFSAWDIQLAELGGEICYFRQEYIKKLEDIASVHHFNMGSEKLTIEYVNGADGDKRDITKQEYVKEIISSIQKNRARELKLGQSLYGPHRDDFILKIDGREAKLYSSQGQQRTGIVALKIAEAEIIEKEMGELPLLILDDVLSELDDSRRQYLLNNLKNFQVIITSAQGEKWRDNFNLIYVKEIHKCTST